jgi:hypothetical protein
MSTKTGSVSGCGTSTTFSLAVHYGAVDKQELHYFKVAVLCCRKYGRSAFDGVIFFWNGGEAAGQGGGGGREVEAETKKEKEEEAEKEQKRVDVSVEECEQ